MAVERRPSPSDAPQGDWPCVVIGSGFTTQRRLRSPTAGISGPRPSLLMIAAKTPSQCTAHASERTRGRAPLCAQGPSAPLRTPPPAHMLTACKQLAQRIPDIAHTQKLDLPKAKLTTRGACREPSPMGRAPCPLPPKGKRGPPKGGVCARIRSDPFF